MKQCLLVGIGVARQLALTRAEAHAEARAHLLWHKLVCSRRAYRCFWGASDA